MKIYIIFPFQDGPYGGGNQFLKALRSEFVKKGMSADRPESADIFLFNSFQDIRRTLALKRKYQSKLFVHRIDGPISLYRGHSKGSPDKLIYKLNALVADATIFQSRFSFTENLRLGMSEPKIFEIIPNASDKNIFYPAKNNPHSFDGRKIRLISTSWSSNPMKGFSVYGFLDANLDFGKFEYAFVGRSPIAFTNIKSIPPQPSEQVAELMRSSDIYITASRKDPCSNSLIEALSCGLPAVALRDGGHPELVQNGGELFDKQEEILPKIELVARNYEWYRTQIPVFSMERTGDAYLNFMEKLRIDQKENRVTPHSLNLLHDLTMKFSLLTRSL